MTVTLDKAAQCRASLDYANEIRTYRADLKQKIAAGEVSVRDVLLGPEDELLQTMRLFELLMAVPSFGRVKVSRVLTALRISPTAKLCQVQPRRREKLILLIEARHPAVRRRL